MIRINQFSAIVASLANKRHCMSDPFHDVEQTSFPASGSHTHIRDESIRVLCLEDWQ